MAKYFREFNEAKLEQVRTHPYYAALREKIALVTKNMLEKEPPRVKFSDIHLFATTGNRTVFQEVYSAYQSRLENYFFSYLLTEDENLLVALSDIIWNICDFESWSIPAHVSEALPEEIRKRNLDLCSTIMGYRISEILYFIGDKLPELVRKRAEYEVRYRVIDSYKELKNKFWWIHSTNNWSSVCIGAVLATYCYLAEEEIEEQLPYMMESIESYLSGFDNDGCCKEGYGYWNYGFSYFCVFASFLRDYTDGKVNLFERKKVHDIAMFQQNIALNSKQCISFSDSGTSFSPSSWLSHFLKKEFPDMQIPSLPSHMGGTAPLRYIFWSDPDLAVQSEIKLVNHIYEDTQWFIHREKDYSFVCKGGNNAESHNHNDVGSFIISKNDLVTFTDPGGGQYTRQYFQRELRYGFLACSSRGHSVPIVEGQYQVDNRVMATVVKSNENEYAFEMSGSYANKNLKSLVRDFFCDEETITLVDTFQFENEPTSLTERFITLYEPECGENFVKVKDSTLHFDPTQFELSVTSEEAELHGMRTVYQVNLEVKNLKKDITCSVFFD